jgi:hypothetical protein
MRPRVLHELTQRLAALLEDGLRGGRGAERIPVFVCHPLDPLEDREALRGGPLGILYPARVVPEPRCAQVALRAGPETIRGDLAGGMELVEEWRLPALWVRVRYVFLVTGGSVDEQLGAIAAALRTIHDTPTVRLDVPLAAGSREGEEAGTAGGSAAGDGEAPGAASPPRSVRRAVQDEADDAPPEEDLPVRLVEDGEAWREIGLAEHRLTVSFEVTVPIASARTESAQRILERELRVGETEP